MSEPNPSAPGQPSAEAKAKNLGMAFASMGVVFGDIGTSPLYALREALAHATQDGQVLREDVLGVVSLLIWALILVVTLKYVVLLLRADNKGEGGILSLVTLVEQATGTKRGLVLLLGIIGAAFFFGDAMITPAISVLSAVEGLKVINPGFEQYVVPSTLAVLITLFAAQYKGTAGVASLFAPITTIWFITIGALGAYHIFDDLAILGAFNPIFGIHMLMKDPAIAILVLGGVFLAVTGGEALYADMGHFGKKPIRMAWTSVVLPALALNYLGQGALIYSDPSAGANPFFLMVPSWGIIPIVMLATMVTVIASQAVITGAFSIAQQAMNLGLFPRMSISHTSETEAGQIYVNQINWLLLVGVIMLVLTFQSSSNLASAYGIAVNTSMIIDSILAMIFFWKGMRWPFALAAALFGGILLIEGGFFIANIAKLFHGGYVPILIGGVIILLMLTWLKGRRALADKLRRESVELKGLLSSLERKPPLRVPGQAVFLVTDSNFAPSALMHNLKHNRVLHELLVFVNVETIAEPRVPNAERVNVEALPLNAFLVTARYGYMEEQSVPAALRLCRAKGLDVDPRLTSYFLGRRVIRLSRQSSLPFWQQRLFIMLTNQSARAIEFFRIPPDRVVELGMQLSV